MRLLDRKFRKNFGKYLWQCTLATFTIFVILVFLDILRHTAIIAALGATAFIVFTMPRAYASGPRPLIGGYVIGLCAGILCFWLSTMEFRIAITPLHINARVIFGAVAVGLAIFLMVITNTEHAPAAGIALGLVLNQWDVLTIIFILVAVLAMSAVRRIFKSFMIDLRDINQPF